MLLTDPGDGEGRYRHELRFGSVVAESDQDGWEEASRRISIRMNEHSIDLLGKSVKLGTTHESKDRGSPDVGLLEHSESLPGYESFLCVMAILSKGLQESRLFVVGEAADLFG